MLVKTIYSDFTNDVKMNVAEFYPFINGNMTLCRCRKNSSAWYKRLIQPHCVFVFLLRDCDVSQINYMYAQYVKNTMQPLNITDVAKDQRFPWTVSPLSFVFISCFSFLFSKWVIILLVLRQSENRDHTSSQIKSLLCTPIRNGKKDKVIGMRSLSAFSLSFSFW